MKTLSFLAATLLIFTATGIYGGTSPIKVRSTKLDIFYFKVDKAFIGAVVNVYSPAGDLILSNPIRHHKVIIDFYVEEPGEYTIKIRKDGVEEVFTYIKKDRSPLVPFGIEPLEITMVQ